MAPPINQLKMKLQPAPPRERFVHVRNLAQAGGAMNEGIAVMIEAATGRSAIRKLIDPRFRKHCTEKEVSSLRKLAGHPNIVQFYDYIPAEPGSERMDELYTEYCRVPLSQGGEYNTLFALYNLYVVRSSDVPEAFVWHLFESLLQALSFMHFGIRAVREQPLPNWDAISHNDLHAANIFMSAVGTTQDGEYPRIVVGDFGCAKLQSNMSDESPPYHTMADVDALPRLSKDAGDIFNLLQSFGHEPPPAPGVGPPLAGPGSPEDWRFSEELWLLLLSLKGLQDESSSVVALLETLRRTKEKLQDAGELKYVPLIQ